MAQSLGDLLHEYGNTIVKALQDKIKAKGLVASAILYQSIKYRVKIFGKDYVMHIGWDTDKVAKYASVMNDGGQLWTNGKMPPVEDIMEWMRAKGIKAKMTNKGKESIKKIKKRNSFLKKKLNRAFQESAQRQAAFGIAMNIKKNGVIKRFGHKGSHFWDEVFTEDLRKELTTDIRKQVKRDIQIEFDTIKKEITSHGG